jgi:uncharacterized protein YcgL (UPF0745 family)
MKPKRKLFYFMVFLVVLIVSQNQLICESLDKIILQEETNALLDKLDNFSSGFKNLNAIFTDQGKANIEEYGRQYCLIKQLLYELENLQGKWEEKLKEDSNDKIYRVFAATVQLALCSIYSSPDKYLTFLKIANRTNSSNLQCANSPQSDELLTYREKSGEWEIKVDSTLSRIRGNINKALELDMDYSEAKILQVQLLVLERNYDEALRQLEKLQNDNVFKDKRSYFNSWKAFIEMKKGGQLNWLGLLRRASTFSEPRLNSDWATTYRKTLNTAKSKWIVFDFNNVELLDEIDLESLKQQSINAVNKIKNELRRPLEQIPEQPNKAKLDQLTRKPNLTLLLTLDSNKSENNLNNLAEIVENLYEAGEELAKCIKDWEELAQKNKEVSYYYLINKASCGLVLLHMINTTDNLIYNEYLRKKLKQRMISREKQIDYASKWKKWSQYTEKSLPEDINKILSMKNDLIYSHLLAFEFDALFSPPQKALDQLDILSKKFKKQNKKTILAFPGPYSINVKAYIASWKCFLLLKKGNIKLARQLIDDSKDLVDLDEWKRDQEKLIYLYSIPQTR